MTDASDTRRRVIELRAQMAADTEATEARITEMLLRLPELHARSGLVNRAAGRIAGSLAWHRAATLRDRTPAASSPGADPDAARTLADRRIQLYQLSRRARAYEHGLQALLQRRRAVRGWRRPGRGVDQRTLAEGRVLHLHPRWGSPQAASILESKLRSAQAPVILVGAIPPVEHLQEALGRLDRAKDLGVVGFGGLSFDWKDGAPLPVPAGPTGPAPVAGGASLLVRTAALEEWETQPHTDPCAWGLDLSLGLATRGWRTEPVPVGSGTAPSGDSDWWSPVADRWGAQLAFRVLSDLVAGGGPWCARSLRINADPTLPRLAPDAIADAGWLSVDTAADVQLERSGTDELALRLSWPGESQPVGLGSVDLLDPSRVDDLVRAVRTSLLRPTLALTIGSRDTAGGEAGGDLHLARALARELARRGSHVVVRTRDHDSTPSRVSPAIRLSLRGRRQHVLRSGQLNMLWLISHPDEVEGGELSAYDQLMVASPTYARSLAERGLRTETVLQFAHPSMFDPPLNLEPERTLAFVGNWRRVYRRGVWYAHLAGLRPALVGQGWRHIAAEDLDAESIPYAELPGYYARTGTVLVDHWDDMRERGFIANRVFDALAAGCAVVCDEVVGMEDALPGVVSIYRTPEELEAAVKAETDRPPEDRARAARTRRALAKRHHTCAHRAGQVELIVDRALGASSRPFLSHLVTRGAS